MPLIDTHAHIYVPEFGPVIDSIFERASQEHIDTILMPAIDSHSHAAMLELEHHYPGQCIAMMGVHPCSVDANYKEELRIAKEHLDSRPFIAVGEIGLDFYWDKTFTEQQYNAFRQQIEWAIELDIPVVIHSRNATSECIDVVEGYKGQARGVFHCFSGNAEEAARAVDLGFYLGIGGVLTFKNSGLDKAIEAVPLSHLVLETDAPYLAPVPYRGKRNEPAYLSYVVDKLATVKAISKEEVAAVTTANARKLFAL